MQTCAGGEGFTAISLVDCVAIEHALEVRDLYRDQPCGVYMEFILCHGHLCTLFKPVTGRGFLRV